MDSQYEKASSLNTPLIHISNTNDGRGDRKISSSINNKEEEIVVEVKKQLWLAGPLICVSLLQFCLQLISVMFVGHLGELALSGASMATSFASVTGFSLLVIIIFVTNFALCFTFLQDFKIPLLFVCHNCRQYCYYKPACLIFWFFYVKGSSSSSVVQLKM